MNCRKCNNLILHSEAKDGMCESCATENPDTARTRSTFTSGRKLLVAMLDEAGFFSAMKDEKDMAVQNYFLHLIGIALDKDPKKYRALIESFVSKIVELSGETSE